MLLEAALQAAAINTAAVMSKVQVTAAADPMLKDPGLTALNETAYRVFESQLAGILGGLDPSNPNHWKAPEWLKQESPELGQLVQTLMQGLSAGGPVVSLLKSLATQLIPQVLPPAAAGSSVLAPSASK